MSKRLAAIVVAFLSGWATAQTITVTAPAGTERVASGGDFATEVIGDPWDMDQPSDVSPYVLDWQSYGIAGGVFSGVTTTTAGRAAQIYVQYQGEADTNHHGREGVLYPIDGNRYRRLAIRMYSDRGGLMRFVYFRQPGTLTDTASSNYVTVVAGWNTYDVDLVALGGFCAQGSNCTIPGWGGTVLGLSVEPNNQPGATIVIDWIRLRSGDTAATTFTARWSATDPTGSAIVDLYADDDTNPGNGFADRIATAVPASNGQAPWPVNRLDPFRYYLYAVIGTTFAGNSLLDPWDMSQPADVTPYNWQSGSVGGGVFSGVSAAMSSALYLRMLPTVQAPAAVYRYLRVRMDVSTGSYARAVWHRQGATTYGATDFITVTPGMKDYVFDLADDPEWYGLVDELRFNPVFTGGIAVTVDAVELSTTAAAAPPTGSDYSSGPLTVNEVPQIHITDPDRTGGEDYATAVLGNPWDMSDAADVAACFNCTATSFSGGQFHATNTTGDSGIWLLNFGPNTLDTSRYYLLSVGYTVDGFSVPVGSVSRVLWRQAPVPVQSVTQDFIQYPGYNVLTADMRTVLLEPISPTSWTGLLQELRFDPHEFPSAVPYHIDFVKVAREDASSGLFNVTWTDSDSDSAATIDLYWDTDNVGFDGTPFVQGLSEDDPGNVYPWNTGTAPQGNVWVYARVTDGLDTVQRYATGLLVNTVTDGLPPYLTLLDPARGATGVSPFSRIRAHVRDTTSGVDIASVQMRVNGNLVTPTITGNAADVAIVYQPPAPLPAGSAVTVQIDADDLSGGGNHLTDSYTFTVTTSTDSDGDGLPDQFEVASDLNPNVASGLEGAAGDPDEDGGGNLSEYQGGTDPTSWAQLAVGPGPGGSSPPSVRILYNEGTPEASFAKTAYAVNRFGVNVGVGDIEAPTARAILTGPGPGDVFGPQVKAFRSNNTDITKVNFYAYGTLKFGCHAEAGDVDGDGFSEILTTPGRGAVFGPHVRGWNFDGASVTNMARISFFAYSTLKYGAHVDGGAMDGDGFSEILTAPGPGAAFGPIVRGFDYDGTAVTSIAKINFLAITGVTQYGAEVASGQVDGDGFDEILAGPGPGPAFSAVFQGWNYDGTGIGAIAALVGAPFSSKYGVVVAAGDVDGDRIEEPLSGPGPDPAGPSLAHAYDFDGGPLTPLPGSPFTAFSGLSYGTRVASGRLGF